MSSCLSLNSMPISFSALCIMSFVMRPGVGDGLGEGSGVGVGVCAIAFNGRLATVNPAAPAAGRSLTKVRRLIEVRFDFFIGSSLVWYTHPLPQVVLTRALPNGRAIAPLCSLLTAHGPLLTASASHTSSSRPSLCRFDRGSQDKDYRIRFQGLSDKS